MARLCTLLPWRGSVSLFHGCDRGGTADPALVCELAGSPAARGSHSSLLVPGERRLRLHEEGSKLSVLALGALFQGSLHPVEGCIPFQKGIPSSVKFYPHPL